MLRTIFIACFAFALLVPPSTSANTPESFENLKVLPKDMSRRELIDVMKSFTQALGVRCQHCHVGDEGKPQTEFDFASDEVPSKEVARSMMRMVDAINGEWLPKTSREDLLTVGCYSCHRGLPRPQKLVDVLLDVASVADVDAALERYESLRDEYYGRGSYDFGERSLLSFARTLLENDETQGAMAALRLNLEHHPESANTWLVLGDLHTKSGQTSEARKALEKVLALEPDHRVAKRMLDKLTPDP